MHANHVYAASMNGNENMIRLWLNKWVNAKYFSKLETNPLLAACKNGHGDIAKFLLERGSDVNLVPSFELTALYAACKIGHENNGTDINLFTQLYAACKNRYKPIASLLIDHGADVNSCLYRKQSSLYAC